MSYLIMDLPGLSRISVNIYIKPIAVFFLG